MKRRRGRPARPRQGWDGRRLAVQNWSPVYRQRSVDDRSGGIEESQTGYKIVETADSQYHRIAVVDDDTSRYLRFDSSFQRMFLNDPYRTRFIYSDYLQLPFVTGRRYAGCSTSGSAAARRPSGPGATSSVACESKSQSWTRRSSTSPTSTSSRPDLRLVVEVEDGRRYVSEREGPWDVIVVDAFYADAIPFHLATREFLELARRG